MRNSLLFLIMSELRDICIKLNINSKGTKQALINNICYFKEHNKEAKPITPIASVKNTAQQYITAENFMIKGIYKNSKCARLFFQKIIGEKFHFTAFGIDWLNDRCAANNSPTYKEFSDMWIEQINIKRQPKEEWQYIIYVQNFLINKPNATRDELLNGWQNERMKHKQIIEDLLGFSI